MLYIIITAIIIPSIKPIIVTMIMMITIIIVGMI